MRGFPLPYKFSMAYPTAVLNVVGLTPALIGEWSPHLRAFRNAGAMRPLQPVLPALTCPVQASMLTGLTPGGRNGEPGHGVVGNGWYNREYGEIHFWKQSNRLVYGEKVWETARKRDPSITTANMFWWFNMHSTAEVSVTPRPIYKADGRKIPDIYTEPAELRPELQERLGRFPLFNFWGPGADLRSSRWIVEASMFVWERHRPTLMLVYLPHLDYDLQRFGVEPGDARLQAAVREVDAVAGRLLDFFRERDVRTIILSEYGIEPVSDAVHVNRLLREDGGLRVREEDGGELLDAGASRAFAVADHQVAHVYVRDPGDVPRYASFLRSAHGVELALERDQLRQRGLDHERSGDIVLVAEKGRWFSYHYWLDDAHAPDFARTVDIHRKPGYDPLELFMDPAIRSPRLRIARKLLAKNLGLRTLMDVVPLDTKLVRGSHGRAVELPQFPQPTADDSERGPLLMTARPLGGGENALACTAVRDVILAHVFDETPVPSHGS
jgi:predicted AlkP superfamily pyrophosphatase or phosphodiesterase